MVPRPVYQALLVALTLAALAGGIWLAVSPSSSPGVEITLPPTPSSVTTEAIPADAGGTPPPQLIDINTATAAELEELPGIAEVLAGRIVAYREENGPFLRTDQLMAVRGIGPATYEGVRSLVTMGE